MTVFTSLQRPAPALVAAGLRLSEHVLALEWHPTLNNTLSPSDVTCDSPMDAWWSCRWRGHVWCAPIAKRVAKSACPYCKLLYRPPARSLLQSHPKIAALWHPTLNQKLTPAQVDANCTLEFWWLCEDGHPWRAQVRHVVRGQRSCTMCATAAAPSLLLPVLQRIHDVGWYAVARKFGIDPVAARLWQEQVSKHRSNGLSELLAAVAPIPPAPVELEPVVVEGNVAAYLDAEDVPPWLATAAPDEQSLFAAFAVEPDLLLAAAPSDMPVMPPDVLEGWPIAPAEAVSVQEPSAALAMPACPVRNVEDLAAAEIAEEARAVVASSLEGLREIEHLPYDEKDLQPLVSLVVELIWQAFERLKEAVIEALVAQQGGHFVRLVQERVLEEWCALRSFQVPSFLQPHHDGEPITPNLMQRLCAIRVARDRVYANFSAPGGGKTLAGLLAAAVVGTRDDGMVLVLCPNNVIPRWVKGIGESHPGAMVLTKCLPAADERPDYLILNAEWFQREDAELDAMALGELPIRCVLIDEAHLFRTRHELDSDAVARRRNAVLLLRAQLERHNPRIAILALTGTPVVNTLREGYSVLEVLRGEAWVDAPVEDTLGNAMALHWALFERAMRWPTPLAVDVLLDRPEVDARDALPALLQLARLRGRAIQQHEIDQILLLSKVPAICDAVRPGTIIYSQFVTKVVEPLREALVARGWRVGIYTGEDQSGLGPFEAGEVDVLIASSTIELGIDGLQKVSSRMIFATLPWTDVSYQQTVARLARPGQASAVSIIVPRTVIRAAGYEWSWDDYRWQIITQKRTLAAVAVDGVLPEGLLDLPEQTSRTMLDWLLSMEDASDHQVEVGGAGKDRRHHQIALPL